MLIHPICKVWLLFHIRLVSSTIHTLTFGHNLLMVTNFTGIWEVQVFMSVSHFYNMCHRGIGRAVRIRTRDGRFHRGIIERVSPNRVFLRPFGSPRNYGGYGMPWGFGAGFAFGIALGAIVTLAFIW
jgi:hypothetical protein